MLGMDSRPARGSLEDAAACSVCGMAMVIVVILLTLMIVPMVTVVVMASRRGKVLCQIRVSGRTCSKPIYIDMERVGSTGALA